MAAAHPLTAHEERTWALLVGVMMWLPAELDAWLGATADVSHAEYGVLRWLSTTEDREIHMTPLAATASVTPSHLSRIVARLEKRGLLTRTSDSSDARRTLARLTDEGARFVAEVEPGYVGELRRHVFAVLESADVDRLEDVAESILTPLRADCVALLPPRER